MKHPVLNFLTLSLFCGLIALGVWQLNRLEWKTNLIAQIDAARSAPAQTVKIEDLTTNLLFHMVTVTGQIEAERLKLYVFEKELGESSRLFARMTDKAGHALLVDLNRPELISTDALAEQQTLTGMLWPSNSSHFLSHWLTEPPRHNAEGLKTWFKVDVAAMMESLGGKATEDFYLRVTKLPLSQTPIDIGPLPKLRNPHLNYAMTWFALAATLAGVWGARTISQNRPNQNRLNKET